MNPNDPGFDAEDVELARLIAIGNTYEQAGRKLGLSKSTVKRRMNNRGLAALVNQERTELVDSIIGTTVRSMQFVQARLLKIVGDDTVPLSAQTRAAAILSTSFDKHLDRITPTTAVVATYGGKDVESLSAEEVAEALASLRAEISYHIDANDSSDHSVRDVDEPEPPVLEQAVEPDVQPTPAPVRGLPRSEPTKENATSSTSTAPPAATGPRPARVPAARTTPAAPVKSVEPEPQNTERRGHNPNPAGLSPWRETPWSASLY